MTEHDPAQSPLVINISGSLPKVSVGKVQND